MEENGKEEYEWGYDSEFEDQEQPSQKLSFPDPVENSAPIKTDSKAVAQTEQNLIFPLYDKEEPAGKLQEDLIEVESSGSDEGTLIAAPEKQTERIMGGVNLENFDHFDVNQRIDSPRSLEICFAQGIDPANLYHKSLDLIKQTVHPLKRNNPQFLKCKYIETENQRQALVETLRNLRTQVILYENSIKSASKNGTEFPSRTTISKNRLIIKFRDAFKSVQNTPLSYTGPEILNEKQNLKGLRKEVVKFEEDSVTASTVKELKGIIAQIRGQMINPDKIKKACVDPSKKLETSWTGESSMRRTGRCKMGTLYQPVIRHKLIINKRERERSVNLQHRYVLEDLKISKRIQNRQLQQKQDKMLREIQQDRIDGKRFVISRRQEYHRIKLLKKNQQKDERTIALLKRREELSKLRQEMRKTASFVKYQARQELKKLALKHNRKNTHVIESMPLQQMYQIAGLTTPLG